ncbi:MAG: sulfotransferase, partial [Flavobacteriales bacterium CG_4_10_14_0_2_um_filter_32_8]
GKEDYYVAVRHFAEELYGKASDKQATYFLDKTPRYSLVVEDVIETFPDGKFLFLWRNPLSLVASMMETWGSGRWNLYYLNVDLYQGLERLI